MILFNIILFNMYMFKKNTCEILWKSYTTDNFNIMIIQYIRPVRTFIQAVTYYTGGVGGGGGRKWQ